MNDHAYNPHDCSDMCFQKDDAPSIQPTSDFLVHSNTTPSTFSANVPESDSSSTNAKLIEDKCQRFLQEHFPREYSERHLNSYKHMEDLAAILRIVYEKDLDVLPTSVQVQSKIANGSFGSIFKAVFQGDDVVLKRIDQVSDLVI
jgi:hypothetical protein